MPHANIQRPGGAVSGRALSFGSHPSQASAKRNPAATSQSRPSQPLSFSKIMSHAMHAPISKPRGSATKASLPTQVGQIPFGAAVATNTR